MRRRGDGLNDRPEHFGGGRFEEPTRRFDFRRRRGSREHHDERGRPMLQGRPAAAVPALGRGPRRQKTLHGRTQRVEQALPPSQIHLVGHVHHRAPAGHHGGTDFRDGGLSSGGAGDGHSRSAAVGVRSFVVVVVVQLLAEGGGLPVDHLVVVVALAGNAKEGAQQRGARGTTDRLGSEEGGGSDVGGSFGFEVLDHRGEGHGEAGGGAGDDVGGICGGEEEEEKGEDGASRGPVGF
mmetsp:Transcript_17498/g.36710  ORF Transcript_17498/g.36710 Transcript_17498/m.36710 type:complete len:237 (+) Transcript_17498:1345-2055(+)